MYASGIGARAGLTPPVGGSVTQEVLDRQGEPWPKNGCADDGDQDLLGALPCLGQHFAVAVEPEPEGVGPVQTSQRLPCVWGLGEIRGKDQVLGYAVGEDHWEGKHQRVG